MPKTIHKSAKPGKFVSKEKAEANPDTTYSQKVFDIADALSAITARFEENRAEYEKEQEKLKTAFGARVDPATATAKAIRASEQEQTITAQIAMLAGEPDSEAKNNRLYQALDRLSELLAAQGRFSEAIEVCPNAERKEHFKTLQAAIKRPDSDVCECEGDKVNGRLMSSEMIMETIYDAGRGELTLYHCPKCGDYNAK